MRQIIRIIQGWELATFGKPLHIFNVIFNVMSWQFLTLWSRYFVSVVGMISSEAAFFYLFLWHSSWKLFPTLEKASLNSSLLRTVIWCWDKAFSWFPFSLCSLLVSDIQLIRRTKGYLVHTVYNYKYCTTSHSGLKTISILQYRFSILQGWLKLYPKQWSNSNQKTPNILSNSKFN